MATSCHTNESVIPSIAQSRALLVHQSLADWLSMGHVRNNETIFQEPLFVSNTDIMSKFGFIIFNMTPMYYLLQQLTDAYETIAGASCTGGLKKKQRWYWV